MSTKNTDSSLLPPSFCIFVICMFEGCSLLSFVGLEVCMLLAHQSACNMLRNYNHL